MIDDLEVQTILRDLPTAPPDEQTAMRDKLNTWRNALRDEEESKLESVFLEPDRWNGQWTDQHQQLADESSDPQSIKNGIANLKYIAAREGKSPDDIGDFMPAYRKAYAQKLFGKEDMDDAAFYSAVQTRFQGRKARNDGFQQLLGDVALSSFEDMATGQQRPTAAFVENYRKENPEFFKGLKPDEEAAIVERLSDASADLRARFEPYAPIAKQLFENVTNQTGQARSENAPDLSTVTSYLMGLSRDDRQAVYGAVLLAAQRSGFEAKGFLEQLGEAIGRGTGGMVAQTVRVGYEEQLRAEIKAIEGGARMGTDDDNARAQRLAGAKQLVQALGVMREISSLAESADPLKEVSKSWLGKVAERGAYGAAGSIGYMAASAIPVVGPALTFSAVRAGEIDRMLNESPELSFDEASAFASAIALPSALLDRLQFKILAGKAPRFSQALQKMAMVGKGTSGSMKRFATYAAGMTGAETAIEMTQNFIPIVVDQLAAALDEDFKKHDFGEEVKAWAEAAPETLASMLIMSLIGAGVATANDVKGGKWLLKETLPLRMAGLSEEQAAKVVSAENTTSAEKVFQEEYAKRTPENIKAGVDLAKREAERIRAEQGAATRARLRSVLQPDGTRKWIAEDATGKKILESQSSEAAMKAVEESNVSALVRQTSGVGEAMEFINSVNAAIGRGEDVQKLVTEQAPRSLKDEYEANPTPENLDRLFDTVRYFGGDPKTPNDLAEYFVKASNRGAIKGDIYRSVIRIHEGADGVDVMRDFSQDNLKRAIAEGDVSLQWVREQLGQLAGTPGFESVRTESDAEVIESFSDVAVAYLTGRSKESQIPEGLRGFLRQIAAFIKDIAMRAYRLKRAIAEGKVSTNLEQLLAMSVGLDVDQIIEFEGQKAQRRMEREALADLEKGDGAQGKELLEVFGGDAMLPGEGSPFFNADIKRVLVAVREFNKGKKASEKIPLNRIFSDQAQDPDVSLTNFAEQGFDFFTVDDLLQAVEKRLFDGRPQFGYSSNDALQGGNYSISKAEAKKPTDEILSPTGHRDWGVFTDWDAEHSGGEIQAGPIRLLKGQHFAKNKGYGLEHIEAEHAKDFARFSGPMENVIHRVLLNFNEVYREPNGRLLLTMRKPTLAAVVELRQERGGFYSVVSAYPKENPAWKPNGVRILGGRRVAFAQSERAPTGTAQGSASPNPPLEPLVGKYPWSYVRTISKTVNAHFSIGKVSGNRVTKALEARLKRNPAERLAMYERARKAFETVRNGRGTSKDDNEKFSSLLQSMGELNAILKILPAEVRGKVGGFLTLANMGKDTISGNKQATIDKFLEKRIAMIDKELERFLQKEYREDLMKVVKAARPKTGNNGVRRSTLGAEGQALSDSVYRATLLDEDATGQALSDSVYRATLLDEDATAKRLAEIEAARATSPGSTELAEEWGIVNQFGDIYGRSAESLAGSLAWLKEQLKGGREAWRIKEQARIDEERARAAEVVSHIGKSTAKKRFKTKNIFERAGQTANAILLDHSSFEQVAGAIFPPAVAQRLSDKLREADIRQQATEIRERYDILKALRAGAKADGISSGKALVKLKSDVKNAVRYWEGRKVTAERIAIELAEKIVTGQADPSKLSMADIDTLRDELAALPANSQKEFVTIRRVIDAGKETKLDMSPEKAIQLVLSWDQPDQQAKMRREGWTDDSFADLLTLAGDPVSLTMLDHARKLYASGAAVVNPVYSRMFSMNLPQVKKYAPTRFVNSGDVKDIGLDGSPTASGTTPSFAKTRVSHSAKIAPADALTVMLQHIVQQSHWVEFAELAREFRSLITTPDVREAIKQSHGEKALSILESWAEQMEQRGGNKGREAAWVNVILGAAISGKAVSLLGFNLKTLGMQNDNAVRFSLSVNLADAVKAMSNPVGLADAMREIWASDDMQNRLHGGATAEAKFLFSRYSGNLSFGARIAEASMTPLNWIDSAAMTLSTSVVYQAAFADAKKAGMPDHFARKAATDAASRAIYSFAQPVSFGQKSNIENSGNVYMKAFFIFMTDLRLKSSIIADSVRGLATGTGDASVHIQRIVAIEVMALLSHVVACAYRDEFTDDEDEDIWSLGGFVRALLLAPVQGYFLLGSVSEIIFSKLTSAGFFPPDSENPLLSSAGNLTRSAKNAEDTFDFDDPEAMFKQWNAIARALAVTPALAAPAVILNIFKPIIGLAQNAESEE